MAVHQEIERKYDVAEDFRLPDLSVDGVVVGSPVVHELSATYFDTADYRLARARVTLRRRTGGADAGWHLKLPRLDGTRDEVHAPLGRSAKPPPSLLSKVRVHVRDAALQPVASIRTTRTAYPLVDAAADGGAAAVLAEVADDVVTAQALGEQVTLTSWREVEVELVTGEPAVLDAVESALLDGGAVPASGPSKLARVLADRVPQGGAAAAGAATGREGRGAKGKKARTVAKRTAGDVVLAHVGAQVRALQNADPWVRADEHDAVHKMRVATRRLRSALSTFRPYVDRERTDPLRDELRWLAGVLGDARDAEVMHARLCASLEAAAEGQPAADQASSAAAERVDADLLGRYRQAHAEVVRVLDGKRYFRLLDGLDAVVADPPLSERASRPAAKELPARARRTWRALEALAAAADAAADPGERETALHEVRKAAKRARYAGEALTPAFGADAAGFATAMESLQEVLGDIQDSVVTREELRAMAARAHAAGEDTFPYGRLAGLEEARAARIGEDYADALRAAAKTARKSWPR